MGQNGDYFLTLKFCKKTIKTAENAFKRLQILRVKRSYSGSKRSFNGMKKDDFLAVCFSVKDSLKKID